ncbi:hypothetical protein [Dokdonella sp.]|uniref:hypothetical protein n=1 Tax=Dokdonella sp. TaxID=2291710 RepID=UPI003C58C0AD
MNRVLPITLASLASSCASTQPAFRYQVVPPEHRARAEQVMCEKVDCIHDVHIVLKEQDGTVFEKTFDSLPAVKPEGVSVYAGQKIFFEAEVLGESLVNCRLVSGLLHPERTLTAELMHVDDGGMWCQRRSEARHHHRLLACHSNDAVWRSSGFAVHRMIRVSVGQDLMTLA